MCSQKVNANGNVLHSEIVGAIKMKTKLSGMPELRLGLNDRVQFESMGRGPSVGGGPKAIEMEDVNFHQCVRLAKFETDRTISFIPPDGSFELMSYRLNTQVKPLIRVEAIVKRHQRSRLEYTMKARSQFKASMGKVQYKPEIDALVWTIKQFQGGRELMLVASFGLPSISDEENPDDRPPVKVQFEIPYFTVSGIQVRYLKIIEKSGYQAMPWVRYITNSGDYQIRI